MDCIRAVLQTHKRFILFQVGITPIQQKQFDEMGGRKIVTSSLHPGCVHTSVLGQSDGGFVDKVLSALDLTIYRIQNQSGTYANLDSEMCYKTKVLSSS